jgi:hypothetical protein
MIVAAMNGHILKTPRAVIDALGGNQPVKELTQVKSRQRVSNWRRKKTLPANTISVLKAALRVAGYDAPDSLWGQLGLKPKPAAPAKSRKRKRVPRSKDALREGAQSSV